MAMKCSGFLNGISDAKGYFIFFFFFAHKNGKTL